MRDFTWTEGIPALLVFFGIGLLLITALVGFFTFLLKTALPLGLLLIAVGVLWTVFKMRRVPLV